MLLPKDLDAVRRQLDPYYREVTGAPLTGKRFAQELGVSERRYRQWMAEPDKDDVTPSAQRLALFMLELPVADWPMVVERRRRAS